MLPHLSSAKNAGVATVRVLVPYCTPLHPLLELAVPGAEFVELTSGYETRSDYPDLLGHWWERGEPFIVNEHDVLPWPGALDELAACPEPWCGFSYYRGVHTRVPTLGCVRFGAEVLKLPNPLAEEGWPYDTFPRGWDYCDQRVARVLQAAGFTWHQHFPAVFHAHAVGVPSAPEVW